mmetsp:Transcript_5986/g.18020  ORF Transcript_5986/g.18020 Transcript_5986/m.18020 type:complete len:815 (+) Transcript_5986:145-2589(+)
MDLEMYGGDGAEEEERLEAMLGADVVTPFAPALAGADTGMMPDLSGVFGAGAEPGIYEDESAGPVLGGYNQYNTEEGDESMSRDSSDGSATDALAAPLRDIVQMAFFNALNKFGLSKRDKELVCQARDDIAKHQTVDDPANLTLKETVQLSFQNAMKSLRLKNMSKESLKEADLEKNRLEQELFDEHPFSSLPLGEMISITCVNCVASAESLLAFLDEISGESKLSMMTMFKRLRAQDIVEARRQCETIVATVSLLREEITPIARMATNESKCIGRGEEPLGRICNGFDSVLSIVLQLVNGITETMHIILGLHQKVFNVLWWPNYTRQLAKHLAQLQRMYGVIYTCNRIASEIDTEETIFLAKTAGSLDPDILKGMIKTDELFGRYFGFHYPFEIRSILQVVNIARESTSSASAAVPGARNVAFVGYFLLYGNLVALNQMGLDIKKASSIGMDKKDVETIDNARLYLNLIDDPLIVAGSKFIAPEPYLHKGLLVESEGFDPISCRLITFLYRPLHLPSAQHPENWVERRVSALLTDDVKHNIEFISDKIEAMINPGAHILAHGLVIHFHGGGFIGQSSKSHGSYVRLWASNLQDAVILSVDYKLAPEYKYPYALNECVQAYKWAIDNCSMIGTMADKVVFCGDSAGGNIATAVAMRCQELGLRLPDGIVLAYPALNLNMQWSPSRLLALFDPMLPYTLLRLCLRAYLPDGVDPEQDYMASPMLAPEKVLAALPPTSVFVGAYDPLLDDSVQFYHNMRRIGRKDMKLKIYNTMPHGFLGMVPVSEEAFSAAKAMSKQIAEYLQIQYHESSLKRAK